jgi:hypothetical protein
MLTPDKLVFRSCKPKTLKKGKKAFPLPRGNSSYAIAKRAEYIKKDLTAAEHYYRRAIYAGDRVESAVKDLAGILHQKGRTDEACVLLERYAHLFVDDQAKFQNLLVSLKRQIVPTGNSLNKTLRITGLPKCTTRFVTGLFTNMSRVTSVRLVPEDFEVFLDFPSHSAARKTLEGYKFWDIYQIDWISTTGEVMGDANFMKNRTPFRYRVCLEDPNNKALTIPVDEPREVVAVVGSIEYEAIGDSQAQLLIGSSLFADICEP